MTGPGGIERAVIFDCEGDRLVGLLHAPRLVASGVGVVIVIGGPQYRAGSHRQFVLMARDFAAKGFPVLRFDYRGMGDAEGVFRGFEHVASDIRVAIDVVLGISREVRRVVILGLCDAASAALMYGSADPRVAGLILLNPWVRTSGGEARTRVRKYYRERLQSRSFWSGLANGRVNVGASLMGLTKTLWRALSRELGRSPEAGEDYVARMLAGAERFGGPMLFVLSGQDLTAEEFRSVVDSSPRWQDVLRRPSVTRRDFAAADHTLSDRASLRAVTEQCIGWLDRLNRGDRATTLVRFDP